MKPRHFFQAFRGNRAETLVPGIELSEDRCALCNVGIVDQDLIIANACERAKIQDSLGESSFVMQNDRVVVLYATDDEHQANLVYDFDVSALANECDLNSDNEFEDDSDR
ncbi:Uncharacterized protein Fot_41600 [Forsythia ovata]|uniref:Uncharacterized protein n=1 Tax=Forsythia ovata TaxID=205694 RepID=A0ABD1RIX0_9LAMI